MVIKLNQSLRCVDSTRGRFTYMLRRLEPRASRSCKKRITIFSKTEEQKEKKSQQKYFTKNWTSGWASLTLITPLDWTWTIKQPHDSILSNRKCLFWNVFICVIIFANVYQIKVFEEKSISVWIGLCLIYVSQKLCCR